ncbi:hypothetical protein BDK92_7644 [Micromonospora pisi]|uniref:Uncharacterized protein n=1 Tax=Micromonospora pisi TaxID=589240 RepID=A0A495JVX4_9ACTN|nr:hypothetical protein BDK92_7644 [Micromonospora pisi]
MPPASRMFWTHVVPYGEVKLDMTSRLALNAAPFTGANARTRVIAKVRVIRVRLWPGCGRPEIRLCGG